MKFAVTCAGTYYFVVDVEAPSKEEALEQVSQTVETPGLCYHCGHAVDLQPPADFFVE